MKPASPHGQDVLDGMACAQCGQPMTTETALCLQPQNGAQCICSDCYQDLLIPGPADAHGNMS